MADDKILYDIDFNVHTETISQGISKAVAAGLGDIDKTIEDLAVRKGRPHLYEDVQKNLGITSSVSEFAAMAASPKYNYTPSTIQTMIRHATDVALVDRETSVDMQYKLDMESAINKLRAIQNQVKKSSLAGEYQEQAQMYYALANAAASPEEKAMLLGRAASRYSSIGARTLVESGAVSPEAAFMALSNAATVTGLRNEVLSGINLKNAQEDAAWAARGQELAAKKARDMEAGFRTMEASSATEELYNVNNDPDVIRYNILSSIDSAKRYANLASTYEEGSAGRRASIMLAKESLRGINVNSMSKAGLSREDLAKNTLALVELTDTLKALSGGSGSGGDDGGNLYDILSGGALVGSKVGRYMVAGGTIAADIMRGRASWLANTKTPYEERQETILKWGEKYGMEAVIPSAMAGAAAGAAVGSVVPIVGTGVGAVGGAILAGGTALYTSLKSTHKLDEKHISDEYRKRAIDMSRYYSLYGNNVEYNYAQAAGETGYTSMENVLGLSQTANMLPGAIAFGGVGEQQMMALSYFPNYWKGLMEGASNSELLERYRYDAEKMPNTYRQYLTSLLPGMTEDLRAYAMSDAFGQVNAQREELRGYDATQRGYIPDLERTQVWRSLQNSKKTNEYMAEQIPELDYPDIIRSTDESWASGNIKVTANSSMKGERVSTSLYEDIVANGILKAIAGLGAGNPFLMLNITLDGETTSQTVGFDNVIRANQTLTMGR